MFFHEGKHFQGCLPPGERITFFSYPQPLSASQGVSFFGKGGRSPVFMRNGTSEPLIPLHLFSRQSIDGYWRIESFSQSVPLHHAMGVKFKRRGGLAYPALGHEATALLYLPSTSRTWNPLVPPQPISRRSPWQRGLFSFSRMEGTSQCCFPFGEQGPSTPG